MSTKCSIKWREDRYHLYSDAIEDMEDAQNSPVYLRLEGIEFAASNYEVTVRIPREWAVELGLVKAP